MFDYLKTIAKNLLFKLKNLNLFDTRSTDPLIQRRQLLSTRLFLLLFFISLFILTSYTSLRLQLQTVLVEFPTIDQYRSIQQRYPDSIQCPCTHIAIYYGDFVQIQPTFHQVCSSDFVTQAWIDFSFGANYGSIWPIDIRTSLSAMWQLLRTFCYSAKSILSDFIEDFLRSRLITATISPEKLLEAQVQAELLVMRQRTSDKFKNWLVLATRMATDNNLMTALGTNYIAVPEPTWTFISVRLSEAIYIRSEDNRSCSCNAAGSCPIPASIFDYPMWETEGTYDLNVILPNKTIPGLLIDCLPIQSILPSTLECFYNRTCLNILIESFNSAIEIQPMNASLLSRFDQYSLVQQLTEELFLEQLENQTIFNSYYSQCLPASCSYSYTSRFEWLYVLATIVAVFGGLNVTLRIVSPTIIKLTVCLKVHRFSREKTRSREIQRVRWFSQMNTAIKKFTKVITELNLINKKTQNPIRLQQYRAATKVYIVLMFTSTIVLVLYTSIVPQSFQETIISPTLEVFDMLVNKYPDTLKCPCTVISIPYGEFIELRPLYHQICRSQFILESWYNHLSKTPIILGMTGDLFTYQAPSFFRSIKTFCDVANLTIDTALRQFFQQSLTNDHCLTRRVFESQINSLVSSFIESLKAEFIYTTSLINRIIHSNQYLSGSMMNVIIQHGRGDLVNEATPESRHMMATTVVKIKNDHTVCFCFENMYCYNEARPGFYDRYLFDGYRHGCYPLQTVLLSSLACWFNPNCTGRIHVAIEELKGESPPQIHVLDGTIESQFSINDSFQIIFNEILIEAWNESIHFDRFFLRCHPNQCTYTYIEPGNIVYTITVIVGLFGGLSVALRIISIVSIRSLYWILVRNLRDHTIEFYNFDSWKRKFIWLRDALIDYNLYEDENQDPEMIRKQKLWTRVYVISVIIIFGLIASYTKFSTDQIIKVVDKPNEASYTNLVQLNLDKLTCPCSRISVKHREFINITTMFHEICTATTNDLNWTSISVMFTQYAIIRYTDMRTRDAAYFSFIISLCNISMETIGNSVDQFLDETVISAQAMTRNQFDNRINSTINVFRRKTVREFYRVFELLRSVDHGNGLMSVYFLNWKITQNRTKNFFSYPLIPEVKKNRCSCATRMDCFEPGSIFESLSDEPSYSIPGWFVGCSVIETVLASSLICFYNQSCLDELNYYANAVHPGSWYNITLNTNGMTNSSRFPLNSSIQTLLDDLFVEEWHIKSSYSVFYLSCSPTYCSYRAQETHGILFVLSRILSFYGGITVSLHLLIPYMIKCLITIKISLTHLRVVLRC